MSDLQIQKCYGPVVPIKAETYEFVCITKENMQQVAEWMNVPVVRDNNDGTYRFSSENGMHMYVSMKIGDYVINKTQVLGKDAFESMYETKEPTNDH